MGPLNQIAESAQVLVFRTSMEYQSYLKERTGVADPAGSSIARNESLPQSELMMYLQFHRPPDETAYKQPGKNHQNRIPCRESGGETPEPDHDTSLSQSS